MMSLFYPNIPKSHEAVKQRAEYLQPETEAGKFDSAVIQFYYSHLSCSSANSLIS